MQVGGSILEVIPWGRGVGLLLRTYVDINQVAYCVLFSEEVS